MEYRSILQGYLCMCHFALYVGCAAHSCYTTSLSSVTPPLFSDPVGDPTHPLSTSSRSGRPPPVCCRDHRPTGSLPHVRPGVARARGRGATAPPKTITPPEWHLGLPRCHGDGWQVWLTHPAHEVSQNQRERGFCGCGRRLPLRGLPDGTALHEDPPEGGGLHQSSSRIVPYGPQPRYASCASSTSSPS